MKTNIELLVKILINGSTVKHKGQEYGLGENSKLCIKYGEKWMAIDCDVSGLIFLANQIDRDELLLQCCAVELRNGI